ncbi:polynucleotide kinase-phosphatase [Rhodocytophaga aerolata]|uniref:Polynucleotide kinase-phosphatase n=1 Tax=Rhodocytophaga aerolata TaxID=455078 RepID=A0ABT8RDN1_9BACT|nr:polynucleotide kinase-phosphatase [Rhodocytophaga aerolata]MDO1450064.1 polynucleotide kinase-phosphatase [Rhodocytophaga aerolata]
MYIQIPELSLVVLIGASGSGKSSFARKHFKSTEVVSSDACRGIVSDDENNQAATADAFELLHYIVAKRLKRGLLTVVDATNVQPESRKHLIQLAREYHVLPVAIVLDMPEKVCYERNNLRPDRNFGKHVIAQHRQQLRKSLRNLKGEGFRHVHILSSEEETNAVEQIVRDPLHNNKKAETGPFDIIGDIHGCFDELMLLLERLEYKVEQVEATRQNFGFVVTPPAGRKAIFLGDLVDRGPASPQVLKVVMSMVNANTALCVPGNHDMKLHQKLSGRNVQLKHGLALTMEQLAHEPEEFIRIVDVFLDKLVSHYVLDHGNLVVAHAGLRAEMQGRGSGAVRAFCLYGETTGETDEFGLPVRYNWAADYRGKAMVVYGHTPVPEPEWLNNTIDIDTGCVFGGALTALRYPEKELVSIPAKQVYYESAKPLDYEKRKAQALRAQQQEDDVLDIEEVTGKRIISTSLAHTVTIREENTIAALEVMSRFAVNPKWLIYLPPTMSPCETSKLPEYLEHPKEALEYYARQGITQVVCQEKHMGSRAVVVICRDEAAALSRFGVHNEGIGTCYTRTGRNFFNDSALEQAFMQRLKNALDKSHFWERFQTTWVCLDCELMPWSAKALALLQNQYASVGTAAGAALPDVVDVLYQTSERGIDVSQLLNEYSQRRELTQKYSEAYRRYCWSVTSIEDYKLAPFHILATEDAVHTDKDHVWHMSTIKAICEADPDFLMATPYQVLDLTDEQQYQQGITWWEKLTATGGEGMVVKPLNFISKGSKGLVQPAVKCRGKEYLRIIYGPEYTAPQHLQRLRSRGLSGKRSLALREFALGMEGLERFARKEPLRNVHECVFGVLALESEPIDPRL